VKIGKDWKGLREAIGLGMLWSSYQGSTSEISYFYRDIGTRALDACDEHLLQHPTRWPKNGFDYRKAMLRDIYREDGMYPQGDTLI